MSKVSNKKCAKTFVDFSLVPNWRERCFFCTSIKRKRAACGEKVFAQKIFPHVLLLLLR